MTLMSMGAAQTPASGTTASPLRAFSPTEAAIARVLIAAARADALFVSGLQRGDDAAALEMERHLRGLLYMGRLARTTVSEAVA